MPAKRSMIQVYLVSMIMVATVPAILLLALWMSDQYRHHEARKSQLTESYLKPHKELLQQQIERTVSFIEYERVQLQQRLRREMKARALQNYRLVEAIYEQRIDHDTPEQIRQFISDLLRTSQYAVDQGGYSIYKRDGTVLFSSAYPSLEGTNISALEDLQGSNLFNEAADIVSLQSEGFMEFDGLAVLPTQAKHRLVAYIKYFAPLELVLATSKFVDAMEEDIQQQVITRLAGFTPNPEFPRLLISDSDNNVLVNQLDPALLDDSRLLQSITQGNGEFVQYEVKRADTVVPAINYVYYYPGWEWNISAGLMLDKLAGQLALERSSLETTVKRQLVATAIVIIVIIFIAVVLARWLARRSALGFKRFARFFNEASKTDQYIDEGSLPYTEFSVLADSANKMIDERRGYEQALRNSEQRFGLALEASNLYSWEINPQLQTVAMSKGFFESLGYSSSIYQTPQFEFVLQICHPQDVEKLLSPMNTAASNEGFSQVQYRLRDIHGDYRWFLSRGGPVKKDEQGHSLLIIGTTAEITHYKQQEQDLLEAKILAEDANHVKSQFIANMSHELRTPLNGILGYAQILLRDQSLSDKQKKSIAAMQQCGESLLSLISDVLDLSDIETTRSHVAEVPVSLFELQQYVSDNVRYKIEEKGLEYSYEIDDSLPDEVLIDVVKVKQILVNFLANAIRYTSEGSIKVAFISSPDGNICFQVSDTGMGIEQGKVKQIFKPFQQQGELAVSGSGLGLTICKRLAEKMMGRLVVESSPGQGSTFSLIVPLKISEDPVAPSLDRVLMQHADTGSSPVQNLPGDSIQQLIDAVNLGDVNGLQTILDQLADNQPAIAWLGQCQQLLDEFNLEAIKILLVKLDLAEDGA